MAISLITDSTCDLTPKEMAEMGIKFAPLKVLFKEDEYIDKVSISNSEFYQKMKASPELPTTSQVNPNEFYELFKMELDNGNEVLGVFISSDLSGTYNSAIIAKEMLDNDDRIHLVDSRTTSFSLGLMIIKSQNWIREGKQVDFILEGLNKLVEKAQLYGMLDSLENLKKGGRLSSGTAMIGKMLNLKPIIEVKEGLVQMANKVRGTRKGMAWMIEQLRLDFPDGALDEIALAHANDYEKLEDLKALILQEFNVSKIHEMEVGSVVGTHTGEGVVGVAYFRQ